MRAFFIFLFAAVYCCFDIRLGYTQSSPWWTHITFMLQHANIMHLIINSISFWAIYGCLKHFYRPITFVIAAFTVSFICSWLIYYDLPTVGASGVVYAMVGIFAFSPLAPINKKRFPAFSATFVVSLILALTLPFFAQQSAALLHLACFVGGIIVLIIINFTILFLNFVWQGRL